MARRYTVTFEGVSVSAAQDFVTMIGGANKTCRIIARCFQDEFVEILESLGATEVISSSKNAFENIVIRMRDS